MSESLQPAEDNIEETINDVTTIETGVVQGYDSEEHQHVLAMRAAYRAAGETVPEYYN